jgi:hypothetical protein
MVSLLSTLRDDGLEAAVTQYWQMERNRSDADMDYLRDSIYILQEAQRSGDASELIKLKAFLYPESSKW